MRIMNVLAYQPGIGIAPSAAYRHAGQSHVRRLGRGARPSDVDIVGRAGAMIVWKPGAEAPPGWPSLLDLENSGRHAGARLRWVWLDG